MYEVMIPKFEKILKILNECGYDFYSDKNSGFSPDALYYTIVDNCGCDVVKNYNYGYFKQTLIFTDFPEYCVKIPFYKEYDEDFYDDDNNPILDRYCENIMELGDEVYFRAVDEEASEILVPIEKIGEVNDYPIYIQQRVETVNSGKSMAYLDKSQKEITNLKEKTSKMIEDKTPAQSALLYATPNLNWNYSVLLYYGIRKGMQLLQFVYANISDLHTHNFGFINNQPVIFDYDN